MAERILCGPDAGVIMLDLGAQPSPWRWPLPTDPLPDPTRPLTLRLCPDCGLAQLDANDTTEPEVPVPESQVVVGQARRAVADLGRLGHLDDRTSVVEFGPPHGGSWLPLLDLTPTDGPADLVVDSFGLMHKRDLPVVLTRRAKALVDDDLAVFLIQPLGDVVAQSAWAVLRHGRHGYFTLTSLRTTLGTAGITPINVPRYDLYGGVAVVPAGRGGQPDADLLAAYSDESRWGLVIPERLACLMETVSASTGRLRSYLEGHRATGTRLFACGAASKAVAELVMVGDAAGVILAIGDTSLAKQGRYMPVSRILMINLAELVAADPAEVLLLLPDLHDELLATHPSLAGQVVVPGAGPTRTSRLIPPGGATTCPGTPGRNAGDR